MSRDDRMDSLDRLVPARPRPGLRNEILGRIRTELDTPSRLDRLLSRPAPWAAAAALLLAVLGANAALEARHLGRIAEIRGEPPILAATPVDRQMQRAEDLLLATGEDPELRAAIRFRLRDRRTAPSRIRAALSSRGIAVQARRSGEG